MSISTAITYAGGIIGTELDKMMTRFKKTVPDFYAA